MDLVEQPFDWNDNFSELALVKLQLLEKQRRRVEE